MAKGNRGFGNSVMETLDNGRIQIGAGRFLPKPGVLVARENRLAELAKGGLLTRTQELVDPARCRIWDGHNRDYAALDETVCADLIESLRAQGRQEVPAIVRRIAGDPAIDFEVICGARRHWTVSWLRANNYPEFRFLVEPRELTDEEAFRLADLENRSRKDLSDFERATDYARAIDRYYGGSQQKMVERLEVSKSWLSRYLELARLPAEVIASFGSPHIIRISHAAILAPLLNAPHTRERVIEAAATLAQQQAKRVGDGLEPLAPPIVVRTLATAGTARTVRKTSREVVVHLPDGSIAAKGEAGRGGSVTLALPRAFECGRPELLQAVADLLDRLEPVSGRKAPSGSVRAQKTRSKPDSVQS